jgi:glyoxylase-like metal-dependent hydrolase (beta-lactamase superfamily II)
MDVGGVDVVPLCDGWAPLPLAEECPDHDVDWAAERARFPWAFPQDDPTSWAWHVHAFLLRTAAGEVLVDTGIGHLGRAPYDVVGRIDEELALSGTTAERIRHVIHTHLHADHAGGSSRPDGAPTFPRATHHVHPADWAFFAEDPDVWSERGVLEAVEREGRLDLAPEGREIVPGVRTIHAPGHTPGHRCVTLEAGGDRLLLAGDLLHVPVQVAHPEWLSNHDVEAELAARSRVDLLALVRQQESAVAVSHFGHPFGRVGDGGWED